MKSIYSILILSIFIVSCQPPAEKPDNSVNEAFTKNSAAVMSYLQGFQNENLDYASLYAKDAVIRGTSFGSKDSLSVDDIKSNDVNGWAKYDFKLLDDPVILLPGVNVDTKMADGSVRYYGDWEVTLSATDSTEAKTAVVKLYESFDFDEEGKIIYQQYYGDFSGMMMYLKSTE